MGKMTNLTLELQLDTAQKLAKIAKLAHTDTNTVICVLLAADIIRSKSEEEKPKKNRKVKSKS